MKSMTQKNWLTDSSGSTWTAESSGSSSGYLEKTTQDSYKYSWDWTQTDSNYTKTDVGYSGQGSYDHTKDTWNSGYSGKSSSDGSSTLTMSSGGSQAHDWKYTGESSEAWTETWTSGSTSGSTSGTGGGSGSSQFVLQCLQTLRGRGHLAEYDTAADQDEHQRHKASEDSIEQRRGVDLIPRSPP